MTEQPGAAPALQFLYGRETSRKLVVFVHGVLGDSLTWTNPSGQSWPELMRDDDAFRDYRIATYRFDSPLLGPASTFQEISTRMLQQLEDSGVFRKYREIYFITHSAGGVVTKRALVTLNNVDIDKLQLVKSVLYIATPAQGADIADLGAWFSLNPQFRDLQSTDFNSYLQNLEDEWADLMRRRPAAVPIAFCAYEKKPLRFRVIVDRKSAFTYCDRNATAFDENHISIVKPASRDSDVYQWARARIQEASELVRRAPSAVSDQKRLEYELKRNAFLLESGKPITTATLMIQLKRPYTPEELGHYRVLLEITDLHRPGDPKPPSLWFAGQNLPNWRGYSMRTHVWSRSPDVTFHRRVLEADKTTEIPLLRISQDINHTGPFQTLDSLNRKHVNVFVTESLADKIEVVGFTADGYLLMGISMKCLEGTKRAPFEPWPIQVSKAEEQIEWLHLEPRRYWPNDNSVSRYRPVLMIDYDKSIPAKSDADGSWTVSPECELSDVGPPPKRN